MPQTIQVAHDFICPWCWAGLLQAKRLIAEEGVEIEWVGYELFPEELEWPLPSIPTPPIPNKPETPTRIEFLLIADGTELPKVDKPVRMRTFNAHQALEFAKSVGKGFEFCEVLYRAYWERGENINELETLQALGRENGLNVDALTKAVETKQFKDNVVGFDDPAHEKGVWNVPTFFIGGERYAEQPYVVLQKAIRAAK